MPAVQTCFTVAEAAYIVGLPIRSINHEIDGRVIDARGSPSVRSVGRADLIYLRAVRQIRTELGPALRRRLRDVIVAASDAAQPEARAEHFRVALSAIEAEVGPRLDRIRRLNRDEIESRPDVRGGEPVLRGTRVPARHVAEMLRLGGSPDEVAAELELTSEQVAAAELFGLLNPRSGRPAARRPHDVSPAR